ncbi:hypothetical protein ABZ032_002800 [Listeria monocytogenes]
MIELTKKQAEYLEYQRQALFDPEIRELMDDAELIQKALLIGYVVIDS